MSNIICIITEVQLNRLVFLTTQKERLKKVDNIIKLQKIKMGGSVSKCLEKVNRVY